MDLLILQVVLLVSIFLLVFLQTSRSIFIRSLGLCTIAAAITAYYLIRGFTPNAPYVLAYTIIFGVLGVLSDLYSATLRTWYFGVSSYCMMHSLYGTMIAIFFLPLIFGFNLAHAILVGTVVGALVGEIRTRTRGKTPARIMKSVLGTVVGLYGMATKILLGMGMIVIILRYP
jgi:uncharacterized protein YqgC (DUF456 family)